jgi:hypothetical protein
VIPTAILLGFFGGLLPRVRWWAIPAVGLAWPIMLTVVGDPGMSVTRVWIGGFLLGALNGALGVAVAWGFGSTIESLLRRFRARAQAH